MDGIIYIPYVNTELDEDVFNYKGTAFDYISELDNVGSNIIGADYYFQDKMDGRTARFNNYYNQNDNYKVNNDPILYYELDCHLMDLDENDLSVINIINLFKSCDSTMLVFSFNEDETNEEVLIELKGWVSESMKIMNMSDNLYSEDIKISLLPKRDFKFKSGKVNAVLNGCLCFDNYDNKITIFVKKIILNK